MRFTGANLTAYMIWTSVWCSIFFSMKMTRVLCSFNTYNNMCHLEKVDGKALHRPNLTETLAERTNLSKQIIICAEPGTGDISFVTF